MHAPFFVVHTSLLDHLPCIQDERLIGEVTRIGDIVRDIQERQMLLFALQLCRSDPESGWCQRLGDKRLAATPEDLLVMKATADRLFGAENYRWSVIGVGYPAEFNMAAMAIMMGGHVRVGLEDNIFLRRGVLATNAQLVEKVVRLANEFEREIATPDEARAMLGLKGYNDVNY